MSRTPTNGHSVNFHFVGLLNCYTPVAQNNTISFNVEIKNFGRNMTRKLTDLMGLLALVILSIQVKKTKFILL